MTLIRAAAAADADAVAALSEQVAAQPLLQRYGVTPGGLSAELRRLVLAPPAAAGDSLLLAERDGGLVGFARFQRSGTLGAGGYLQLIALRPGSEGGGSGALLLDAVERAVAERSHSLFLLTADFNLGAQRFYERRGYQRAGALPAFARPGIIELLYWKRLR